MLYACFDFRFDSAVALGELPQAADDDDRPVVTIRYGPVPSPSWEAPSPFGISAGDGAVLLAIPGVARYRIVGGDAIVVEPAPGAAERDVRLFLLGSALGILAYRRGLLPLHANAIVVDGGAYAFSGPSGAGKSTLAAHFARAGYDVLCDDVCALSFDGEVPRAWPGLPRLKLWEDAARAFGHDPAALDRAVEGAAKYHVALARAPTRTSAPLRRLYVLARADADAPARITRLTGGDAMAAAMEHSYRHEYLAALGLASWHFRRAAAMLRHVEVYAVTRRWGFDVFAQEAARLEAHVRAA